MALIPHQNYQWATGYNNAAGLANVETNVPTYQGKSLIVQTPRGPSPGIAHIRADKLLYHTGFSIFEWLVPVMGVNQYDFIQLTYTVGGTSYSGKMTIRTKTDFDSYANYSAMLHLPTRDSLERKLDSYRNVRLRFVVEATL